MIEAQRDQVGDIRFAHAHDSICAPPIDFYRSIGLRNGAASEDHIVDISSYLPGILRLQNPRVAHADDLCRVPRS